MYFHFLAYSFFAFTFVATATAYLESRQSYSPESACIYGPGYFEDTYGITLTIQNKTTPETGGLAKGLKDNITPCGIVQGTGFAPYGLSDGIPGYRVQLSIKNSTNGLTCVQNAIWAAEKQHVLCVSFGLPMPGNTECAVIGATEANESYGQHITSDQYLAVVQINAGKVLAGGGSSSPSSPPGSALGTSLAPCGLIGPYNPRLISATDYYAQFIISSDTTACIQNAIMAAEKQNVTCSGSWVG